MKFFIPALYLAFITLVVIFVWNEQSAIRRGGSGPLYRNLMDCPAYIRRGFDASDIVSAPQSSGPWVRFGSPQLRINKSSLPNLPKRPYLSPWGRDTEEFTVIIAVEMDAAAIQFLDSGLAVLPGIYFAHIGENWEIYFNGRLIRSEMHLDAAGQIKERRTWRSVYFPLDRSLILPGTNILALRIIGDPASNDTGFYYTAPYYLDDFRTIEKRQQNFFLMILWGISCFTGLYYLLLFFFIRRRQELYNLFYGIFSILLFIYSFTRNGLVHTLIPNSSITIRLEFLSLFMMVIALCFFLEFMVIGKITKISWAYAAFCSFISVSQIFFTNQYGNDMLAIWDASVLFYLSYIFFRNVIYLYFLKPMKKAKIAENRLNRSFSQDRTIAYIMFGTALVYICGIFDLLDVLVFHNSFSLFIYSTFVVHIGFAITLLQRFSGMYTQLEQSNIILEKTVHERTAELEKQTEIAVEANRTKSDFLAVMSHEIRTPLNAVIGLSQVELQSDFADKLPESSKENITHIHRSGSYLLGIINDILDISKIESGNFELIPVKYDTASLIGDTINLNRVRIGSKPINFVLEIGSDFPARLTGDELRVKQILNNILSNAVKYTREGTITLNIECFQNHHAEIAEENKETSIPAFSFAPLRKKNLRDVLIRFTVKDTGIGIRRQDMSRLFESYTQLDSGVNRKTEGTGLGLSIAKELAGMMGGTISVESEYGKGSTFTVELMQGAAGTGESIGEKTAKNLRELRYSSGWQEDFSRSAIAPAKVLVVDDVPANLLVARGLAAPYGLDLHTAASGPEAIEQIKKEHYDLVFIDHMMPGMDGIETAAAIKALTDTKLVALTANAMRGMREYYLECGFDDYLSKPINVQALDEILVKWIGSGESSPVPKTPVPVLSPFSSAIESQCLDMLNHYRVSFEIGKEFEPSYFERFTALVRVLDASAFAGVNEELRSQIAVLLKAGQEEDAETVRKNLPLLCEALKKQKENSPAAGQTTLAALLPPLKKAIQAGKTAEAENLVREMGTMNLDSGEREFYFKLNDLILENQPQKILETIERRESS